MSPASHCAVENISTPATRTRSTTTELEEWPNFFTENGRYRITTAENEARGLPLPVLYAEGRAMLRDRVASLRHANIYEPQRYRHLVSSILVERDRRAQRRSRAPTSSSCASCRTAKRLLFASGRYLDRIALAPELRYEERVVICDSRALRHAARDPALGGRFSPRPGAA